MTALAPEATARVEALRRDFDSGFARPPAGTGPRHDDILAIGVGDTAYALRVADLAGLYVDKPVTAVPGSPTAVRGVAGFRGAVVVVFDLSVLLGGARDAACRWIVTLAAEPGIAFTFSRFDGHLRVPQRAISASNRPHETTASTSEVVRVDDAVRPIVSVSTLLDTITPLDRSGTRSADR